jgi:hypothetical protein
MAVEFPGFLYGSEEQVHDQAKAEGIAWATSWRQNRALGALRRLESGELVIVERHTLDADAPRWRLIGAGDAMTTAMRALDVRDRPGFEAAVLAMPWGALAACAYMRPPNPLAVVTARAQALFAAWEPLATLRYIGRPTERPAVIVYPGLNQTPLALDQLVAQLFDGTLAMWGPMLGEMRARLTHALDAAAAATADDTRDRIVATMVSIARKNPRLSDSRATDTAAVAAEVASLSPAELEGLRAGVRADLVNVLYRRFLRR